MKKSVIIVFIIVAVALIVVGFLFTKTTIKKADDAITEKITKQSIGSLCSGEQGCKEFCQNNRGRCEEYCKGSKNELCKKIFPVEEEQEDTTTTSPPQEECASVIFTHYIIDPKFVKFISQLGLVGAGNTEMVGRSYVFVKDEFLEQKTPIYAPTDMRLIRMSYYVDQAIPIEQRESASKDYAMTFEAGCGITITLAHLKELVSPLKEVSPPLSTSSAQVQVKQISLKAGDLMGYYLKKGSFGAGGFDFVMNDQKVINQFANQKRYEYGHGSYNLHTVCPFDYYSGEMKEAYYNILPEKDCGTMGRDKIGTISGQWFLDPDPKSGMGESGKEGDYGVRLPIVRAPDRITIGYIGPANVVWIYPNNPTFKDPKEITTEHCYQNYPVNPSDPQGHVYFKIIDNMTMDVYYSETGTCPSSFQTTGAKRYYR